MIPAFFAVIAASAPSQVIESVTIAESECYAMESRDGQVVNTPIPDLRVIERTARDGPFTVEVPRGAAIACPRSSIIPAPNDRKVLDAGYPLYIMETNVVPADRRVGVLEISQGQVRYRLILGDFIGDEEERLGARLNQLQEGGR